MVAWKVGVSVERDVGWFWESVGEFVADTWCGSASFVIFFSVLWRFDFFVKRGKRWSSPDNKRCQD